MEANNTQGNSYFYGGLVVRNKNKITKIIPICHNPYYDFDALEVCTTQGDQEKGQIIPYDRKRIMPMVKLDRQLKSITLKYYLGETLIDVRVESLFGASSESNNIDPVAEKYKKAYDIVQNAVDSYNPTEAEKEQHSYLVRSAAVDNKAKDYVLAFIGKVLHGCDFITAEEQPVFQYKIWSELYGMGILQPLDDDPEVGEIMVNASKKNFHCEVYYIKNQIKYKYDKTFKNVDELKRVLARVLQFESKTFNEVENNKIEATSPRGDRINLIVPEASENYLLNIRKFTNFLPDLNSMYSTGTIDKNLDKLLKILVVGKSNTGIGGPMGTGKTTMINFMLTYTAPIERKVIIASVSEMDTDRVLKGHDVAILKVDEKKNTDFASLLSASLRTTADRVIIPESRGGEFKSLYEANLKTKGNMFTAHATDAEGFMNVCVDMYMSSPDAGNENSEYIKNKLVRGIDAIIIMRRVGNLIRIQSVSEIVANKDGGFGYINELYYWNYDRENPLEGHYSATGNSLSPQLMDRLNSSGVPFSEIEAVNDMLKSVHEKEFSGLTKSQEVTKVTKVKELKEVQINK